MTPRAALDQDVFWGNSGNLLLAAAAWSFYATPDAELIASGTTGADPDDADRVNAEFDAFVLPLANAFRPRFVEALDQLTAFIRRLTIPVVVLGVGIQRVFADDSSALDDVRRPATEFLSAVLDRTPAVGVRGEITADWLHGPGFGAVDVIGCPSMFLRGAAVDVRRCDGGLPLGAAVAIATNPRLAAMGPVVATALASGQRLSYVAQHTSDLRMLLDGAPAGRRPPTAPPLALGHPLLRRRRARFFVDPWPWIRFLSRQDFAFGTRIHGAIAAVLGGTPALVLAHDARTVELARACGLPHVRLDRLADPTPAPAELYELADYSAFAAGHRRRFEHFVDFLDRQPVAHAFASQDGTEPFLAAMAATPYPRAVRPPRRVGAVKRADAGAAGDAGDRADP